MIKCTCRYDKGTKEELRYTVNDFIDHYNIGSLITAGKYIRVPATFDIETTTLQDTDATAEKGEPVYTAFMYHWQMCIEQVVVFGRTWSEWLQLLDHLKNMYQLNSRRKLVIYVHNLSFEFQFIYRFININSIFRTDVHKVLKICFNDCFERRCAYYLSNMSLAKFIENTPGRHYQKAVNDLDYRQLRTPKTQLTDIEYGYCYNDVRGLYERVTGLLSEDTIDTIPLTSTGFVRRDCRLRVRKNVKNRKQFEKTQLNRFTYQLCRDCFRGGNTASNRYNANRHLYNVNSFDITSSYPTQMLLPFFPVGKFMYIDIQTLEELQQYNAKFCTMRRYTFINMRLKKSVPVPYIPWSRCLAVDDPKSYNGRIIERHRLKIGLTNIDFDIVNSQYEYDELYVDDFHRSRRGYLPIELRNQILHYFYLKSTLKGVPGKEYEYMKAKNRLNGIYGMCVTDILHDTYEFNDGEFTATASDDIEGYYNNRNNFLSYQWGVYVTALRRQQLQKAIDKIGLDVVYVDTDSVKYVGDHTDVFNDLNRQQLELYKKYVIKADVTVNDKNYILGLWDHDRQYDEFITLGSKKYAYQIGDKIGVTVSGLNKKKGREELKQLGGLSAFRIGTVFNDSGRTVRYYNNDQIHDIIVNGETIQTAANIAIVDTTYTLGITDTMMSILLSVQN